MSGPSRRPRRGFRTAEDHVNAEDGPKRACLPRPEPGPLGTPPKQRGSRRSLRQQMDTAQLEALPLSRAFVHRSLDAGPSTSVRRRRQASRSVARTRDVSGICPRSSRRQQGKRHLQALSRSPDGLEPSTPSLPWRFPGGTGAHRRACAITVLPQIGPSRCVNRARTCPS